MNTYTFRRYCLFAIALFVNALGIALITKALLGTSPITSVTYVDHCPQFTFRRIGTSINDPKGVKRRFAHVFAPNTHFLVFRNIYRRMYESVILGRTRTVCQSY